VNTDDTIKIQELNKVMVEMLGMNPITEIKDGGLRNTPAMNYGLAQVYANEGFRAYMQEAINRQLRASLTVTTLVDLAMHKARVVTLKELLRDGKQAFDEYQKIQQLKK
jgi:hypothetical protein